LAIMSVMQSPLIANNITELIGRTPCVRILKFSAEKKVVANLILKLESQNPCSSVKDRLALALIEGAESRGEIKAGETVLIEPTSGNTGVGLAMVSAAKGYEFIATMPATMSMERRVMLKALGARVVLTDPKGGMKAAIAKANQLVANYPEGKARILQQFENTDNPAMHRRTTGPEIWEQTEGKVDFVVAGVGTGGTLSGITQFLRSVNPEVKAVAVEPQESSVLSGNAPAPHKIQGIGAGFIPANCHTDLINEIIPISSDTAIATARRLAVLEGVFCGISSGAAVAAACELGARPENEGKTIVVIIPSFGERYLSTVLFADLTAEALAQQPE